MTRSTVRRALAALLAACLAFGVATPALARTRPTGRKGFLPIARTRSESRGLRALTVGATAMSSFDVTTPPDAADPADDTTAAPVAVTAFPATFDRNFAYEPSAPPSKYDYDIFKVSMTAGSVYSIVARGDDRGYGEADPMIGVALASDVDIPGNFTDPFMWGYLTQLDNSRSDTYTAEVNFAAPVTGDYYVVLSEGYNSFGGGQYKIRFDESAPTGVQATKRIDQYLGQNDRYSVAAALAAQAESGTMPTTIIIASGLDRAAADPLTAGSLSGLYNAPILLIRPDWVWKKQIPSSTRDYLLSLKARGSGPINFLIAGGPASVPDALKAVVLKYAPAGSRFTARFGGADRYAVAVGIAAHVRARTGASVCFVTNGQNPAFFYDTLAASALAAAKRYPILLSKTGSVPTVTYTESRRYAERIVVGTTGGLWPAVATRVGATHRIGYDESIPDWGGFATGYDRQYMARLVAEYGVDRGWAGTKRVAVANKLMDALGAGSMVGRLGGTLLFCDTFDMDPEFTEGWIQLWTLDAPQAYVVGGPSSVDGAVVTRIDELLGYMP